MILGILESIALSVSILNSAWNIIKNPKKLIQMFKLKKYRCKYWLEIDSYYSPVDQYLPNYDTERRSVDKEITELETWTLDINPKDKKGKKRTKDFLLKNQSRTIRLMGRFKETSKDCKPAPVHYIEIPNFENYSEIEIEKILIKKIKILFNKIEDNELEIQI